MRNNDKISPKLSIVGLSAFAIDETDVNMEMEVKFDSSKEENNDNAIREESNWFGVDSGDKKEN